jgi:hypothetical protein
LRNKNESIFVYLYKLKTTPIRNLEIKCDIAGILNLGPEDKYEGHCKGRDNFSAKNLAKPEMEYIILKASGI